MVLLLSVNDLQVQLYAITCNHKSMAFTYTHTLVDTCTSSGRKRDRERESARYRRIQKKRISRSPTLAYTYAMILISSLPTQRDNRNNKNTRTATTMRERQPPHYHAKLPELCRAHSCCNDVRVYVWRRRRLAGVVVVSRMCWSAVPVTPLNLPTCAHSRAHTHTNTHHRTKPMTFIFPIRESCTHTQTMGARSPAISTLGMCLYVCLTPFAHINNMKKPPLGTAYIREISRIRIIVPAAAGRDSFSNNTVGGAAGDWMGGEGGKNHSHPCAPISLAGPEKSIRSLSRMGLRVCVRHLRVCVSAFQLKKVAASRGTFAPTGRAI